MSPPAPHQPRTRRDDRHGPFPNLPFGRTSTAKTFFLSTSQQKGTAAIALGAVGSPIWVFALCLRLVLLFDSSLWVLLLDLPLASCF